MVKHFVYHRNRRLRKLRSKSPHSALSLDYLLPVHLDRVPRHRPEGDRLASKVRREPQHRHHHEHQPGTPAPDRPALGRDRAHGMGPRRSSSRAASMEYRAHGSSSSRSALIGLPVSSHTPYVPSSIRRSASSISLINRRSAAARSSESDWPYASEPCSAMCWGRCESDPLCPLSASFSMFETSPTSSARLRRRIALNAASCLRSN